MMACHLLIALCLAVGPDAPGPGDDPRYGLLSPIPGRGGVPPIVELMAGPSASDIELAGRRRRWEQQIRRIAHEHFGSIRVPEIRADGIERLQAITDPVAFAPMVEVLEAEDDDVRLAVLDHLADLGDQGQAAVAWVAIQDESAAIRHEAVRRLKSPASEPVLALLDQALRSPQHEVANNAGTVAGAVQALQAIPLLIFAQATTDTSEGQGDLAWIAIQTQRAFIARVDAVVNDGVAAFIPIPGVVSEGVILRVVDAVVIVYRTEVHRSLVAMTTQDWGQSTAHLGYDMNAWWHWYNEQYVPYKNREARIEALSGEGN